MATRLYPYVAAGNDPDVSPAFDAIWDSTSVVRVRRLYLDTRPNTLSAFVLKIDDIAAPAYHLLWQFVSEPLDAISATFAVSKAAFKTLESNAKVNGYTHIVFRKCDSDGGNPVTIGSITDDTEFGTVSTNRFVGASNLTDQALSQSDRLIVEVGYWANNSKTTDYYAYVAVKDNHASTDLPENDTETAEYNSWIETGDTFTEASGDPPAEVVKLGPMFAFA